MTTGIWEIILYKVAVGKCKVPLMMLYIVVSFKNLQRCDKEVSSISIKFVMIVACT